VTHAPVLALLHQQQHRSTTPWHKHITAARAVQAQQISQVLHSTAGLSAPLANSLESSRCPSLKLSVAHHKHSSGRWSSHPAFWCTAGFTTDLDWLTTAAWQCVVPGTCETNPLSVVSRKTSQPQIEHNPARN
jgi:hypothetical protein